MKSSPQRSPHRFIGALFAMLAATGLPARAAEPNDPVVTQILADISSERIARHIDTLAGFGTRHIESETASETHGIGAARRWIERELRACSEQSGGRLQVALDEWVEPASRTVSQPTPLVNVVATLPGVSPASRDRVLVVSGHYDSRNTDLKDGRGAAPGADDDGSGVAVVMELACAMARQRLDATVVFIAVAGEEQGLLGAEHWAAAAHARGTRIDAMITNDIVGSPVGDQGQRDAKQLRLFAGGVDPLVRVLVAPAAASSPANPSASAPASASSGDAELRVPADLRERLLQTALAGGAEDLPTQQLGRHLKAMGERYLPGFTVNLIQRRDRYLRGGDHLPFLERGDAAVRFTEPFENFDHQHQNVRTENGRVYGDLPEFVDASYVADVARINAAGLATLALAPAAPRDAHIDVHELTNATTLTWAANSEPELVGYRVVWRSTDSTEWQHARDVGLVTRATLDVSKDNVIFGVEAVSKRGLASLASFPLPQRR